MYDTDSRPDPGCLDAAARSDRLRRGHRDRRPISIADDEVILSPDADESVALVPEISLFDGEILVPEDTLEVSALQAEEAFATEAAVGNQPIAANSIPSRLALGMKETYRIDISGLKDKITCKSSNTEIATVSRKGVIKARHRGKHNRDYSRRL